ncbi:MAG: glycosyltransferase family 9 protein, partial [Pseudomonadota bacterium]
TNYPYTLNLLHEMLKRIKERPENLLTVGDFNEKKQHRAEFMLNFITDIITVDGLPIDREYAIFPQPLHAQRIDDLLKQAHVDRDQHILIGMQLGCHRTARRGWKIWQRQRHVHKKVWPIEYYTELAKKLKQHDANIRIVVTGSKQERYLAKMFLNDMPDTVDMIGKTSLLELAALMDKLNLLISHDTGTMHIACARRLPLVTMFASTATKRYFFGPFPPNDKRNIILESDTIENVTVDSVYQAALKQLAVLKRVEPCQA